MGRVLDVAVEALVGVAQGRIGALPFRAAEEQALAVLPTRLGRNGDTLLATRRRRVGLDVGFTAMRSRPRFSRRIEVGLRPQWTRGRASRSSRSIDRIARIARSAAAVPLSFAEPARSCPGPRCRIGAPGSASRKGRNHLDEIFLPVTLMSSKLHQVPHPL